MLHIHRGEGTAVLADALAGLLQTPLADPFATEVVAVPAKGVERWLAQRLSAVLGTGGASGDGICAGVAFPSPARLVDDVLATVSGAGPDGSPWARPVWPLLETLDACLAEPWCAVLAQHLGGGAPGHRRGRRYATAAHLADLFRSYAAARPEMLRDWAAGRDTDGSGPLPDDLRWQAELWRQLRTRLGPSPAERLDEHCAALRADPDLVDLPPRLSVFGPTRLTADQLAVLAALGAGRDVHVWLPHASPALWTSLQGRTAVLRADDASATLPVQPLLRSLGRDVRELQLRLPPHVDTHHPDSHDAGAGPAAEGTSLLHRLQADLREDRAPSPGPADGSVVVHACHGPARQVEVLREVLLRLFEDDPTLEPRDVLVLCPDVETFAPLVSAAFGLGTGLPHPCHALRVRLADRSLRQTNPLLDTVAGLLELAGSRVTASAVLDLAATPAVRARFAFTDEQLERVRDWVARSGVRWGLDPAGRAPYRMDGVPQNTWRAGLDRVLLGVTTSEDEPVTLGLALPLDDVDSSDIDLAGRLAELLDRLEVVLAELTGEQPPAAWAAVLTAALDALTAVAPADSWQLSQARRELAEAVEGATAPVGLADLRALLAGRLRGQPTRANFRTGNLTVCTMVPMRSVPHRVVVLLGLDDGVFPRTDGVDGDDVLARAPRVGERDVAAEDRQLLLDALLATTERLVVLFTGADPVSGAERPPAVPVGELLDVLALMAPSADVVVRQPLQPYDAAQFAGSPPFSFDPVALAGARTAAGPRTPPAPRRPLPVRGGPVALEDLVAFLEHPVRGYLRQRLALSLPGEDDEVDDALPVALDGLQEWALGERLLRDRLRGLPPAEGQRVEWLRGTLPPGPLGGRVLDKVQDRVEPLVGAAAALLVAPPEAVDVSLTVAGRLVAGTVGGVRDGTVVSVGYATLSARHRVRAWVLALALAAAGAGDRAVTVGRYGRRARTATVLAPDDPVPVLAALLALYDKGTAEPLPMAVKTSAAYAASRQAGDTVEQALESAGREWRSDFGGEREDRHHRYAWGDGLPLTALLEQDPWPDETVAGESTRFGALARGLWTPLLQAEQIA